jgi:hypothetical protein
MDCSKSPDRPFLFVDIDGVISLFGFPPAAPPSGRWVSVEGVPHLISATVGQDLLRLGRVFDLVWCSGWEDRADEHLTHLLGLPNRPPFLTFGAGGATPRWKMQAIERHAGGRPLAWIDDNLDAACHAWAGARDAPTLLVPTDPARGMTAKDVQRLERWARDAR